mgnify:CR=1 FL=1
MAIPAQHSQGVDCIIIGAGVAGLMAAQELSQRGKRVCVLEKGRGLGGRMATRRHDGAVFDHGAQFFTVRDPRFEAYVNDWRERGLVVPWYDFGSSGMHYRGDPGMTAIAKYLAAGLDVRREVHVEKISFDGDHWCVFDRNDGVVVASHLLITAPLPQALALLRAGTIQLAPNDLTALQAIRYHRCIAALATLDQPSAITGHTGALKLTGEPIQWIADNFRKGISPSVPSVTIHSTPAFAEAHWDIDDAVRLPKLLEAASEYLGAKVLSCHSHRWGFSQPMGAFRDEAFVDPNLHLAIAGDGLAGGRVEGAALSGLTTGRALAGMFA